MTERYRPPGLAGARHPAPRRSRLTPHHKLSARLCCALCCLLYCNRPLAADALPLRAPAAAVSTPASLPPTATVDGRTLLSGGAPPTSATAPSTRPIEGPSPVPLTLALLLMLALLGGAAWVLRRTSPALRSSGPALRVVAQLALTPRERVVVIEVGDRWLLLGVGSGGITRLGTLPPGSRPQAPLAPLSGFSKILQPLRRVAGAAS